MIGDPAEPRESLGRLVRQVWTTWAVEQDDPKPSWLLSWEELGDDQREVDMRIGQGPIRGRKESCVKWKPVSGARAAGGSCPFTCR